MVYGCPLKTFLVLETYKNSWIFGHRAIFVIARPIKMPASLIYSFC